MSRRANSNPATGIPTVTWRIREGENPGYTLFDLADRMRAAAAPGRGRSTRSRPFG